MLNIHYLIIVDINQFELVLITKNHDLNITSKLNYWNCQIQLLYIKTMKVMNENMLQPKVADQ